MKKILLGLLIIGMFTVVPNSYSGDDKVGEAGFMFLKTPIGARETSMGMTGLTTSNGANAIFWNPAAISHSDGITLSLSHLSHFAGINSEYIGMAMPVGEIGSFAVNLNYVSWGKIEITTADRPEGTGVFYSPSEVAFGLSYSRQVTDRVSAGMTVKYIYSKIDQVQATGFGFDFGFIYNTNYRGLKLGFTMMNLGPQAKYEGDGLTRAIENPDWGDQNSAFLKYGSEPFEMPASVSFGVSMDAFRNEQNAIVFNAEENVNNFQGNRSNLGFEYSFKEMFFLRGGYSISANKKADLSGSGGAMSWMTLGAGIAYTFGEKSKVAVDYGYMNQGDLNPGHRLTFNFMF